MKADTEADIGTPDRGELPTLMEPLVIGSGSLHRGSLSDLAFDLIQKSAGLRRSLKPPIVASLAELVRAMNCYYSNLIEGHDTHPVDIERALRNDYSHDPRKRDLQLEAKAHISVQAWIDTGALSDSRAVAADSIREIHRRFCELVPDDILWVTDPATQERVQVRPGEFRTRDVQVGSHVAVSPGALPRFMQRFEQFYWNLGKAELLIASAAMHHRLLWMHPFVDGNGRVARLMSHAVLLDLLDTGAVWSVARGLARNVQEYRRLLANCDQTRRNDLDGRGTLSEEALVEFSRFFLQICIDQVQFMESLIEPERLQKRILLWADEEVRLGHLPAKSGAVLEAVLYRGELSRGEVERVVGTQDRQARRIISALVGAGVLISEGARAPLQLAFPAALAGRWMPGLFPESA